MSNTKKHKDKGKFHNNILKYYEVCESTRNMWDRWNNDLGEFRKAKKDLEDKISEKEMLEEVRVVIEGENIDFTIEKQDKILEQIMGRS